MKDGPWQETKGSSSKEEPQTIQPFFNPCLSSESYSLINEVWNTHLTNQRKDFRKVMTALAQYMFKEEDLLREIKECIKLIHEKTTIVTLDPVALYDLCGLVETPVIIKFKRIECWKRAQKSLTPELLEIMLQKITYPKETKELLEDLLVTNFFTRSMERSNLRFFLLFFLVDLLFFFYRKEETKK